MQIYHSMDAPVLEVLIANTEQKSQYDRVDENEGGKFQVKCIQCCQNLSAGVESQD